MNAMSVIAAQMSRDMGFPESQNWVQCETLAKK